MYSGQQSEALGKIDPRDFGPPQSVITPKAPPQIGARLEELHKATEALHQSISELENRISGVLRPVPPQGEGTGRATDEPLTAPLAVGIRELAVRVFTAGQRIQALTQRVEL